MFKFNPALLTDFYKQCHAEQYDTKITKLVSYYTPRMSRHNQKWVVVFGIQSFVKEWLIDYFNEYFFNVDETKIIEHYTNFITKTLGSDRVNSDKILKLYRLGYLPIQIRSLPEGTRCPIKVPMFEISNTHDDFPWITNFIETLMSSEIWYQMTVATINSTYREITNKWYDKTCDYKSQGAISEFGFRGLIGVYGAIKASSGFLLSFNKTATCPAIEYLNYHYGDNLEDIATGMASTEHSVMCSSFLIDGNEYDLLHKLITKIYPTGNLSIVCDSYDYWNLIIKILPKLKSEIENRDGVIFIRGDSGDPVNIVTKTVHKLYQIFGGSINSKGFIELPPYIKAIYGDSITHKRADNIYEILYHNNFSASNVILGAGSFSMLCEENEDNVLLPFTRDSFGVAIKTTYAENINNKSFFVFKNPKTDTNNFKKSQKGCCIVYDKDSELKVRDQYTHDETFNIENEYQVVFDKGNQFNLTTLNEIRQRFWNNKF